MGLMIQPGGKMAKTALFGILRLRENFGCHPSLGRTAAMQRVIQLRESNRRLYRIVIKFPDGQTEDIISLPDAFQAKGLSLSHPAVQADAPVFVVEDEQLKRASRLFFVKHPEEMLRLLRFNLAILQRLGDEHSERLHQELMGMSIEQLKKAGNFCLGLVELKKTSQRAFVKFVEEAPNRKLVLEAADRGEIMEKIAPAQGVASRLEEGDVRFLIQVVRARYLKRLREMIGTGAKLSELGRKVFKPGSNDFTSVERQTLLMLAIGFSQGEGDRPYGHVSLFR